MYKAFLFDMDGTLVDTFQNIHESFNAALRLNGKRELSEDEFSRELFGKSVDETLPRLVGGLSDPEKEKIREDFKEVWIEGIPQIKIFKNITETLQSLKDRNCKLAVVSTSPRGVIEKTLAEVGILHFFDAIVGEEDAEFKKPHKEPVEKALSVLGVKPEEAIFIGDTEYDIIAGRAAGCHTVLKLNGRNDVAKEADPDEVIFDLSELL